MAQAAAAPENTREPDKKKARKRRLNDRETNEGNRMQCFLQPKVLVVDDNPGNFLNSLEHWIESEFSYLPDFKVISQARSFSEIEKWLPAIDHVLLDHRIEDKFKGFNTGAEIGIRIKQVRSDVGIAYYTGYPRDLKMPAVTRLVKELEQFDDVVRYNKSDLHPGHESFTRFCESIAVFPAHTPPPIRNSESAHIPALAGARFEEATRSLYRVEHFDRRKAFQTIRCYSDLEMSEIDVPTRRLVNLGVTMVGEEIWLKVVKFDRGQVLSYLEKATFTFDDLADEVIEMLEGGTE